MGGGQARKGRGDAEATRSPQVARIYMSSSGASPRRRRAASASSRCIAAFRAVWSRADAAVHRRRGLRELHWFGILNAQALTR